jgi:DNA-binding response OmpR family regulator
MPRVLIVDDDTRYAGLVQHALEIRGFEARVLTDLSRAVLEITSFRPDIVLLDVYMPELSGPELMRRLGRSWNRAGVRFLLYSNMPESELAEMAQECGADGYVVKRGVQALLQALESLPGTEPPSRRAATG